MLSVFRALALIALMPGAALGLESSQGSLKVDAIVTGLDTPWAFDLLPDGGIVVTEKEGKLLLIRDGQATAISGVPEVGAGGQGGLMDVTVARDFAQSQEIFLSFTKKRMRSANTALAVARLDQEGAALRDVRILFEAKRGFRGGRHYGSRVVEAPDGTLFLTLGDRGDRPSAQDRSNHNGAVIRINRDGSVPADNPFVGQSDMQPEIWSFGHRNPQGAALDAQGRLWTAEHGARGGDEINLIEKSANYGWPVISYGTSYSGTKIGEGTAKPGMEQPAFYWDPSIAPSGLMVYSGKLWPDWRGHLFVGSLKFGYLARLSGDPLAEVERLESDETSRLRDVHEGPDGAIWFLSEGEGALYRLTPG